ncbi:unnamed protein product [Pieris macdunnoughi]|nr:unnamed protein product [Pieris macdunnoughi]CAF4832073.1 unnamed protein product [Pieris macdunnoughi]CAF4929203.1 unnamed protein product [Pieris macdunnoughi]
MDTRPIINGEELNLDDTTVFLGITMDSKLQWSPHINGLAKRLSSAAYAVKKIRSLTDVDTARLVYFSYFHSLMTYGLLLWGHAADVETIFILQKRAIRAIYNLKCRESLRDKFKEINILTFPSQYIYENIMYVYKNSDKFTRIEHTHNVNTRNKRRLQFPRTRLSKVSNSFLGKGILFFNKIPEALLSLPFNKFKKCIKEKLCKKAYYKVNDYLVDKRAWD